MTTGNKRGTRQQSRHATASRCGDLVLQPRRSHDIVLTAKHYATVSPAQVRSRIEGLGSINPAPAAEPFRLFRPTKTERYRMTFCISGVRYSGSTLCEDEGFAAMVAKLVYAEIKETAGRVPPDDIRRRERTVVYVRGCWLTSRPKRLPSVTGRRKPNTH